MSQGDWCIGSCCLNLKIVVHLDKYAWEAKYLSIIEKGIPYICALETKAVV